jgi:vitamin B12 transporter
MKKRFTLSLIGLSLATPIYAADNINLDDVVVTAARVLQPRESVISDVTVINHDEIERSGQLTFVELLQSQPGVEISSNGGAGEASSIFLRGTNAGHVIVLIDGMRMMSATLGTATWENIPVSLIDRIEILRGSATSLYGQDAIGGVIQIFTKKGVGSSKVYANLGYGSYQTTKADAGAYGRSNDLSYALSVATTNSNGISALNSKNPIISDKDPYRNFAFTANISEKLAEGHEIGVQIFNSYGTSHYDNSFNLTNFSSSTKLNQQSFALTSKNQWNSLWLSSLRVGFTKDKFKNYDEIDPFNNPFNPSITDTEQTQINWQNDLSLPIGTLTLMYDRLEDDVSSTTIYDKTSRTNNGYVASYLANIGAHSIQLSLRNDTNSQFGSNNTGNIGYGFSFNPNWRITTSYGSAFKAPTFNDLYFPGFNNPNLKPEKSDNVEASLHFQDTNTHLSATVYENRIRNLIAFDFATSSINNVNKAIIHGLTITGSQKWGNFQANSSVDIQSPHDSKTGTLLPRRANRHGSLNLNYDAGDWRFGIEAVASSVRYNNPANTVKIDGYSLINFSASYQINQDWSIQARANNIFDKHYVLAIDGNNIDYNTPGANLFVNIRYQPE